MPDPENTPDDADGPTPVDLPDEAEDLGDFA